MNNYDYDFDYQPRPARKASNVIWNVLTILVLVSAVCLAGGFLIIFLNPNSSLNPFPPPLLPDVLAMPTASPTPRSVLPPTWTPAPTLEPTATFTPRPSSTPLPTETPFSLVTPGAEIPTVLATAGGMPFVLQSGNPLAIANIYHPDLGCNWMGVGGQVFDLKGAVVLGQQIQLGGVLNGTPIPSGYPTLTGVLPYAPGYYEFTLGDKPSASTGKLWVQLVDQAGLPMSDKIVFDTYDDCQKNLIIINFKQVR
jgi:hypothetical protein